jgi:hypothetical protein
MAKRASELGAGGTAKKAASKARRGFSDSRERKRDLKGRTYAKDAPEGELRRLIELRDTVEAPLALTHVCEHYLEHRFDVLGSGWTHVGYGIDCRGLEGVKFESGPPVNADPAGAWLKRRVTAENLRESARIWALVDPGYVPIDWQLDIRSGYRWDARTWYRDIEIGHERGADVKVPWELARGQHLPQMGLAAACAESPSGRALRNDFRNQVLDFIATNPPRFGVNWSCAMDVAIRLTNWLIARDLFLQAGRTFDSGFERVFARSVLEHGRHIRANLEGTPELRTNHYLADLVGLLFASASLPLTDETREWEELAAAELVSEIPQQFSADGSNFEASVPYHGLSMELALHGLAIVLRLRGPEAVSHECVSRVEGMVRFLTAATKPDGRLVQVGDNDSGRLFKLGSVYRRMTVAEAKQAFLGFEGYHELPGDADYWLEDPLRVGWLAACGRSLLAGYEDETRRSAPVALIETLAEGRTLPEAAARTKRDEAPVASGRTEDLASLLGDLAVWTTMRSKAREAVMLGAVRHEFEMPGGGGREGLELVAYPDFGLFIIRSQRIWAAVRCGPVGQNGYGGHAHNDQLELELTIDGTHAVNDPGTYVYTPLPERRNEYRSVHAHFAPRVSGAEPASLDEDLFRLADPRAHCQYFGEHGFVGCHEGYGSTVWRLVEIADDAVRITDWTEADLQLSGNTQQPPYSPGYGMRDQDGRA